MLQSGALEVPSPAEPALEGQLLVELALLPECCEELALFVVVVFGSV